VLSSSTHRTAEVTPPPFGVSLQSLSISPVPMSLELLPLSALTPSLGSANSVLSTLYCTLGRVRVFCLRGGFCGGRGGSGAQEQDEGVGRVCVALEGQFSGGSNLLRCILLPAPCATDP